jgi:hypothetical protein
LSLLTVSALFHTDNDDDDEEAGIEPSSSNCRNGLSYKHILFQKQTRKGKLKDKAGMIINDQLSFGCCGYLFVIP